MFCFALGEVNAAEGLCFDFELDNDVGVPGLLSLFMG